MLITWIIYGYYMANDGYYTVVIWLMMVNIYIYGCYMVKMIWLLYGQISIFHLV